MLPVLRDYSTPLPLSSVEQHLLASCLGNHSQCRFQQKALNAALCVSHWSYTLTPYLPPFLKWAIPRLCWIILHSFLYLLCASFPHFSLIHSISHLHPPRSVCKRPCCGFPEFFAAHRSRWICSSICCSSKPLRSSTPQDTANQTQHCNDPLMYRHTNASTLLTLNITSRLHKDRADRARVCV